MPHWSENSQNHGHQSKHSLKESYRDNKKAKQTCLTDQNVFNAMSINQTITSRQTQASLVRNSQNHDHQSKHSLKESCRDNKRQNKHASLTRNSQNHDHQSKHSERITSRQQMAKQTCLTGQKTLKITKYRMKESYRDNKKAK